MMVTAYPLTSVFNYFLLFQSFQFPVLKKFPSMSGARLVIHEKSYKRFGGQFWMKIGLFLCQLFLKYYIDVYLWFWLFMKSLTKDWGQAGNRRKFLSGMLIIHKIFFDHAYTRCHNMGIFCNGWAWKYMHRWSNMIEMMVFRYFTISSFKRCNSCPRNANVKANVRLQPNPNGGK